MPRGEPPPQRQAGLTYLWVLLALFLLGLGMGRALDVYHVTLQRQKEEELLYVGLQFRKAIASYCLASPGNVRQYPAALQDLLSDSRFFRLQRHIRRIYSDPMAPELAWGVIRDERGRIVGIYSRAPGIPLKKDNFPAGLEDFRGAQSYSQWRFVYVPPQQGRFDSTKGF